PGLEPARVVGTQAEGAARRRRLTGTELHVHHPLALVRAETELQRPVETAQALDPAPREVGGHRRAGRPGDELRPRQRLPVRPRLANAHERRQRRALDQLQVAAGEVEEPGSTTVALEDEGDGGFGSEALLQLGAETLDLAPQLLDAAAGTGQDVLAEERRRVERGVGHRVRP